MSEYLLVGVENSGEEHLGKKVRETTVISLCGSARLSNQTEDLDNVLLLRNIQTQE